VEETPFTDLGYSRQHLLTLAAALEIARASAGSGKRDLEALRQDMPAIIEAFADVNPDSMSFRAALEIAKASAASGASPPAEIAKQAVALADVIKEEINRRGGP